MKPVLGSCAVVWLCFVRVVHETSSAKAIVIAAFKGVLMRFIVFINTVVDGSFSVVECVQKLGYDLGVIQAGA